MSKIYFKVLRPENFEFGMSENSITLGRGDKVHIKLNDEHCSQIHCKIFLMPIGLFIEDLRSKNGTFLNNLKIEKAQIFFNDNIRIGDTQFMLLQEKCHLDLKSILTFDGTRGSRMANELRIDNNLSSREHPMENPQNLLAKNPLFKDSFSKEEPKEKSFLQKINPFKK